MKVAFIVAMHKCSECERKTFDTINDFIKSLYKSCKHTFTLYLFDNESDEKYTFHLNYPNVQYEYIEDQHEGGLARPYNSGIIRAVKDGCDIIIISNDDIILNESINDFINIINNFEHKDVGLFGPLTSGIWMDSLQKTDKKGTGIREITNEIYPLYILNGFLLAFTKEFYEKFKLEDGNLCNPTIKWGGGEIDLTNRIKLQGGRSFIIDDCWINHIKLYGWVNIKL